MIRRDLEREEADTDRAGKPAKDGATRRVPRDTAAGPIN